MKQVLRDRLKSQLGKLGKFFVFESLVDGIQDSFAVATLIDELLDLMNSKNDFPNNFPGVFDAKENQLIEAQIAWESLDSENRAAINRQVCEAGIVLFTARVGEGDLRAEVYEGDNNGN